MLKTRIITAVIALALVAIVLFALPPQVAEIIIALVLVAGAWEWSGFLDMSAAWMRVAYVAVIAGGMALVALMAPQDVAVVLQVACAWWGVAFLWALRYPTPIPVPLRSVCGLFVLLPLFAALVQLYRFGVEYLIFTLLIVWVADGGAYFAGKMFGRVKLAPKISPGKTWEGVVGGMLLVAVLAVATALWRDIDIVVLLPFCLAVAAISIVGDLTVSMFKRTSGVKDSGSLFPGHGGVLDRVDSVAAAAPLFMLGLGWLGLAS
jgi:phosphatidate cytidylyltransferase